MTHLESSNHEMDVLKCGYMSKQGKRLSRWRERYFTLHSNATLKYYYEKTDKYPGGIINLSLATNITKKKSEQFVIITSDRNWKLKLKSISDRDSWFDGVYNVWKDTQQNRNNYNNEHSALSSTESEHVLHKGIHTSEKFKYDIDLSNFQEHLDNDKNMIDNDEKEFWNVSTPIIKPRFSINRASFILTNLYSKNSHISHMSNEEEECHRVTAKCLLKLLNGHNSNKYLYFIYQNLRNLAKERDITIVDKMLEQAILTFEVQIQKNICNILYLIQNDHKILINTLKICETEDRAKMNQKILTYSYQHWVKWRHKQQHNEEIHVRDFVVPMRVKHTMKQKLLSEILDGIIITMNKIEEQESLIEVLKTLSDNMKQIDSINDSIHISFPPHYNIINFYVIHYYKLLTTMVMGKLKEDIEVQDTIFVIKWIELFKLKLGKLGKQTLKMQFTEKQIFLMKIYVDTATEKWHLWVNNIVQTESDTRDFFVVSDIPRVNCVQDLFTALNHQFENITEGKMSPVFLDIIMLMLKTLYEFHALLKNYVDCNGAEFEDEYYCALINSIYDVSLKLCKYQEKVNDISDELNDEFDETISNFTSLAKHCAIKFTHKICNDTFEKNVFNILFTLKYFNDEINCEIINGMIETIKDYLQDLNIWIEEKYFIVSICKCFVQIIYNKYVKALINNQPRTSKLIYFIRNDAITMNKYFGNMSLFEDVQFNKIWKDKYEFLMNISNALDIDDEFFDVYAKLLAKDTTYGYDVLEYIKKKRKIQQIDGVLSNNKLRKLKHNPIAKKMGKLIQKTKEKKNNKKKQKQKTKKRTETF